MMKSILTRYILIVTVLSLLLLSGCGGAAREAFAQCLTENSVTMFGTYWCPHCARQKDLFGTTFEHVNYIECSEPGTKTQNELCDAEGIEQYPTWKFADGSRHQGVQTYEQLAALSGCPLA